MRHISIKWRMTIWFTVVMVAIAALVLVFVMLMNRNSVTRPPEAELVYMVQRNADDVEFDHGGWDFSDVELYGHGVYTVIFDENGQRLAGTAPASVTDTADYPALLEELRATGGKLSLQTRFRLMQKAFAHTAAYDAAIARFFGDLSSEKVSATYPTQH